jgi:hypothetical protein
MPANTSPIFGLTSKTTCLATSGSASTSLTSPTNLTTLYTAGTDGGMFLGIHAKATASTTAGMIRLWFTPSGGTIRLLGETLTAAVTPSGTVASAEVTYIPTLMSVVNGLEGLPMASGDKIEVNTHNAETWNVTVYAVNF